MKNAYVETLFQHVEMLQQRKLYWKQRWYGHPVFYWQFSWIDVATGT